jgi:23S rRNA (uridine2552-2'-O)-methyltransferase
MERQKDYYTKLARCSGYAARSVYKLKQMNERFRLIKAGSRILDLGAFPGSWSSYALEVLKGRGRVVGVDLQELKSIGLAKQKQNWQFIRGDIFSTELLERLIELGPFDLILSDTAPATSGNKAVDCQRSLEIGQRALTIAESVLKKGGQLVIKIFQGGEEKQLLEQLRKKFVKARAFKPDASRKESKELFFLGFKRK